MNKLTISKQYLDSFRNCTIHTLFIFGAAQLSFADTFTDDFEAGLMNFRSIDNTEERVNMGKFNTTTGVNPMDGTEEGTAARIGDNIGVDGTPPSPGAWIQLIPFVVNPTEDFTLTYNVYLEPEGTLDDATIVLGALDDRNYYNIGLGEASGSQFMSYRVDNVAVPNNVIAYPNQLVETEIWYTVTITWNATTKLFSTSVAETTDQMTPVVEFEVTLDDSEEQLVDLGTLTQELQFGFGTFNDSARYDNITLDSDGLVAPTDSDGDDLPNSYEIANNLNPNSPDGDDGRNGDFDNDGLTNFQEFSGLDSNDVAHGFGQTLAGTADMDGDSLSDGDEVNGTRNPYQNATAGEAPGTAPGLATNPFSFDSDGDAIPDNRELLDYTTNPNAVDTDGNGISDSVEIFVFGLDASDPDESPTAEQAQGLWVNFRAQNSSNSVPDFQNYEARTENLDSFTTQMFSAFGGTSNISVTPSWDDGDGQGVAARAPRLFSRTDMTASPIEWDPLVRNWIGTDARMLPGDPMTLTISGIPAGNYIWTSYHTDINGQTGEFDVTLQTQEGTFGGTETIDTNTVANDDVFQVDEFRTYQQSFRTDGSSDLVLTFDVVAGPNDNAALTFLVMNAFTINPFDGTVEEPEPIEPNPSDQITINQIVFDERTGDLLIDYTPINANFTLTASPDLETDFSAFSDAELEDNDQQFRIPASFVPAGRHFFRVENLAGQ